MIKLAESGDTNTKLHAHDGAGSIVMASHEQIEEEMHWKILYDPTSGRYYYEDERTGETTWDPPSHIAEVLNSSAPEMYTHALKASPEEHFAAYTIQGLYRARLQRRKTGAHAMYEKHLDMSTGRYYFVATGTGESSWDTPHGEFKLTRPPAERTAGFQLEKALAVQQHKSLKEERALLIAIRQEDFEAQMADKNEEIMAAENARLEGLWGDALRLASDNGEVNMSWQKLGHIDEKVFQFTQTDGAPLVGLRLVGHELTSVPTDVGSRLTRLTSLSLASNNLEELPDNICELAQLQELNLLRNKLTKLPTRIGDLQNLKILHIASNKLETLPASFGNLHQLTKVVLEANKLRRLPESIGRLNAKQLNLNGNELLALPHGIVKMPHLERLSVSDNKLKYLPRDIGKCPSLTQLHCSANDLMELPDSLGRLKTLKELWLDQNNLSALPWNFFQLANLQVLNMESNPDMVHPTHKYLSQGVETVLEWSLKRHKHALHVRRQTIIVTLQNMFEQLKDQKLAPAGLFEPDIECTDDKWYSYINMESFWTQLLPILEEYWLEGENVPRGYVQQFPFERNEVDHVVANFQDPYGAVTRKKMCMFKRCMCVDQNGNRRVCVPPKPGWMCERMACLLKMDICLEREKAERERVKREHAAIEAAQEAGKEMAKDYCESDEGKKYFYDLARKKANDVVDARRKQRWANSTDKKLVAKMEELQKKYEFKRKHLQANRDAAEDRLREKRTKLEEEADELEGYAREVKENEVDAVMDEIAEIPEQQELDELEKEHNEALDKIEAMSTDKKWSAGSGIIGRGINKIKEKLAQSGKEHKQVLKELSIDLIDKYIEREAKKAKKQKEEEHKKMRIIAARWTGMNKSEVFQAWSLFTKRSINQNTRDAANAARIKREKEAAVVAAVKLSRWNVAKWEEAEDVWSDKPFWTHVETGETRWDEPLLEHFLPANFVVPEDLKDKTYEELNIDTDEVYTEVEVPYPKAEPGYEPSEASESDNDSDSEDDEEKADDAAEEKEDGEGGATPLLEDGDADDDSQSRLTAVTGLDDDLSMLGGGRGGQLANADPRDSEGALVVRTDPPEPPPVLTLVDARAAAAVEADDARRRMNRKRQAIADEALRKKNEAEKEVGFLEHLDNMVGGKKKVVEEERPQTVDVMELVGFDPTKEYTNKQLTELAAKAVKVGKGLGLENEGAGRIEKDGENFGHDSKKKKK